MSIDIDTKMNANASKTSRMESLERRFDSLSEWIGEARQLATELVGPPDNPAPPSPLGYPVATKEPSELRDPSLIDRMGRLHNNLDAAAQDVRELVDRIRSRL